MGNNIFIEIKNKRKVMKDFLRHNPKMVEWLLKCRVPEFITAISRINKDGNAEELFTYSVKDFKSDLEIVRRNMSKLEYTDDISEFKGNEFINYLKGYLRINYLDIQKVIGSNLFFIDCMNFIEDYFLKYPEYKVVISNKELQDCNKELTQMIKTYDKYFSNFADRKITINYHHKKNQTNMIKIVNRQIDKLSYLRNIPKELQKDVKRLLKFRIDEFYRGKINGTNI